MEPCSKTFFRRQTSLGCRYDYYNSAPALKASARRSDIGWQFLLEAMTLTFSGGAIGIAGGCLLSFTIRTLLPSLPTTVPLWSVVAGFVVATSIGLFFGIWPATKAARLDPIVALRYE